MEYIFGTSTRDGMTVENLKTVGEQHANLSGFCTTVRKFQDGSEATDRFRVLEHYHSAERGDKMYDWYIIDSHTRNVKEAPNRAATAAVNLSRRMLPSMASTRSADDTSAVAALYDEWTEGSYQVGDIRLAWYNGSHQPWKCRQEHDTTTYPDITPDGSAWRTFWIPFHGTTPETAQDWIAPSGAHDQYEAGEYMVWTDGNTYLCKQATVYTPEEYAKAWEVYNA